MNELLPNIQEFHPATAMKTTVKTGEEDRETSGAISAARQKNVWKSFDIKLLLAEKLWNLAHLDSSLSPEEQLSGPLLRWLVNMDKM